MSDRLIPVNSTDDIFPQYRQTLPGLLLEYHNLVRNPDSYDKSQMLVGNSMDNRKHLRICDNFAYIIRLGGANFLKYCSDSVFSKTLFASWCFNQRDLKKCLERFKNTYDQSNITYFGTA